MLGVSTGRRLAYGAVRPAMAAIGWQARASGWFTRDVTPSRLGVAVVTTRVLGVSKGQAYATVLVGVRDEAVERLVAELSGGRDQGYRQRTVLTGIGSLMFHRGWHEWHVSPKTSDAAASAMADAVRQDGEPWMMKLAIDDAALATAVRAGLVEGVGTMFRVPIIEVLQGRVVEASQYVAWRTERLAGQSGPAVDDELRAAEAVRHWIDHRAPRIQQN